MIPRSTNNPLLFRLVRIRRAMERLHVPAHAKRVIAAKVAQVASELEHAGLVNVPHVPLHVRLVGALVRAERAGELRVPWVHLAAELHVPPEQILQREHLLAEPAHVAFVDDRVTGGNRRGRVAGDLELVQFRVNREPVHRVTVAVHVAGDIPHTWNRPREERMKRSSRMGGAHPSTGWNENLLAGSIDRILSPRNRALFFGAT